MVRLLLMLVLVGLIGAWWLGYVPARTPATGDVDRSAARQRGGELRDRVAEGIDGAEQVLDDATLTAKITSKMALDDLVSARRIDVDTVFGAVTLSGVVGSERERQRAVQLASETVGVRSVADRLRTEP